MKKLFHCQTPAFGERTVMKMGVGCMLILFTSQIPVAQTRIPAGEFSGGITEIEAGSAPLPIRKTEDFAIDGSGSNPAWVATPWTTLTKLDEGGHAYASQFKMMYSRTGIYLLFSGEDSVITTSDYKDMDRLWNGDVFEAFFHPDPGNPVYFEYEVNPLGKQLLLTISNSRNGMGWIPFNEYGKNTYETHTRIQVNGGPMQAGGIIDSWIAEVFISFKSLGLLPMVPPKSGSVWKANFCRLDHDTGRMIKWSWTPSIEKSLHELNQFNSVVFE